MNFNTLRVINKVIKKGQVFAQSDGWAKRSAEIRKLFVSVYARS